MGRVSTESQEYADRLVALESVWWKRLLPVQAPYRWNLRRRHLERVLDVGCGVGRNLAHLSAGSLGVDHNPVSVRIARERGLDAVTTAELATSYQLGRESFDSILLAHVVEHLTPEEARALVREYLPYLRPGGRVLFICPQERGYASDPTHVTFTDGEALEMLARDVGLTPSPASSFPLPRRCGKAFVYNEFIVEARKTG